MVQLSSAFSLQISRCWRVALSAWCFHIGGQFVLHANSTGQGRGSGGGHTWGGTSARYERETIA